MPSFDQQARLRRDGGSQSLGINGVAVRCRGLQYDGRCSGQLDNVLGKTNEQKTGQGEQATAVVSNASSCRIRGPIRSGDNDFIALLAKSHDNLVDCLLACQTQSNELCSIDCKYASLASCSGLHML